MLKIKLIAKLTNEEILRRANSGRTLMKIIYKQQLKFVGHVLRKGELENLMLNGKIEGKKA